MTATFKNGKKYKIKLCSPIDGGRLYIVFSDLSVSEAFNAVSNIADVFPITCNVEPDVEPVVYDGYTETAGVNRSIIGGAAVTFMRAQT